MVCTYQMQHVTEPYQKVSDKCFTMHRSHYKFYKPLHFEYQNAVKNKPFRGVKTTVLECPAWCAHTTQKNLQNNIEVLWTSASRCTIRSSNSTNRCILTSKYREKWAFLEDHYSCLKTRRFVYTYHTEQPAKRHIYASDDSIKMHNSDVKSDLLLQFFP